MRFSILMPTHNRPQFIRRAVDAILDQDFGDFELLIADGGETILELLPSDARIKYWHWPQDNDRLNTLFPLAQGEILTFQADDDIMLPGALAHMHGIMVESVMWAYGRIQVGGGGVCGGPWNFGALGQGNYIPAPAVFWRRAAYEQIGRWDMSVPLAADYDYWLRLGSRWTPVYTDRVLVNYTVHPDQDSVRNFTAMMQAARIIQGRYRQGYYARQVV